MPKIVLALSALATFGVSAETYYSGQADAERRERNREEALANYRAGHSSVSAATHARAALAGADVGRRADQADESVHLFAALVQMSRASSPLSVSGRS